MNADINSVFVRDPAEPVELGETKQEAPVLDWVRFHLNPKIWTSITMSKDPSDGSDYALLIGLFIDGVEVKYVTDWLRNDDPKREREYALDIPKSPVKLMQSGKAHSVQIKVGERRTICSIPVPTFLSRNYDLAESEISYYKIGPKPAE